MPGMLLGVRSRVRVASSVRVWTRLPPATTHQGVALQTASSDANSQHTSVFSVARTCVSQLSLGSLRFSSDRLAQGRQDADEGGKLLQTTNGGKEWFDITTGDLHFIGPRSIAPASQSDACCSLHSQVQSVLYVQVSLSELLKTVAFFDRLASTSASGVQHIATAVLVSILASALARLHTHRLWLIKKSRLGCREG